MSITTPIEKRKKSAGLWLADAINPAHKGLLHRELGVSIGTKIPMGKLRKASKGDSATARRARLALTMRGFAH